MSGAAWVWVMCAALLGCNAAAKEQKPNDPQSTPRKVELVRVESVPMDERIVIAGTLAAQDEVTVKSKVAGRLSVIDVDLGSVLKTGQRIAQIEPVDYRLRVEQASAALGQAKAALGIGPDEDRSDIAIEQTTGVREATATFEEARANFERAKTLVEKKLIGRADFDTANAAFLRAQSEVQRAREEVYGRLALLKQRKAELGLARQQLEEATIRSPLDGVVQVRHASAGEFLAQGADVATVVRIDPLRMRVEVPEREAVKVALDQRVSVHVDERSETFSGRVARLSPMLSQLNRTLMVEAEIPNRDGSLRPGTFARAEIALGQSEPVLTVPKQALVVFAGIQKVIAVEGGTAVEKPVETGRSTGALVEVTKGLDGVDAVVLAPGTLQQGQPVEVTGIKRATRAAALGTPRGDSRVE